MLSLMSFVKAREFSCTATHIVGEFLIDYIDLIFFRFSFWSKLSSSQMKYWNKYTYIDENVVELGNLINFK